jgi:hypothetical protein
MNYPTFYTDKIVKFITSEVFEINRWEKLNISKTFQVSNATNINCFVYIYYPHWKESNSAIVKNIQIKVEGINKNHNQSIMKINHCFILLLIISLISISCSSKKKDSLRPDLSNTNYIYIDNKTFKHKNDTFFPIMLNYVIACRSIDNKCVISPLNPTKTPTFMNRTRKRKYTSIGGHFQLIHELGINCLRICFDEFLKMKKDTILSSR